ncbi:hypothetical protein BLX24_30115 [Arsenicibacter rosenii]|uniref:Uncharacterized protein n=2 Tax=Arsenicibacter rosenii TaxID=1750698 RepID=A0A1S2V9S3_9BACT|nr:hypothetical protein BLX24_30115 [Arsenicibacter rosenii]
MLTFTTDATGTPSVSGAYIAGYATSTDTCTMSFFGTQLEVGSFATSIIPTPTAAVTRGGDLLYLPVSSNWYNPSEGTLFVEARPLVNGIGSQVLAGIGAGSGNCICIRQNAVNVFGMCRNAAFTGQTDTAGVNYALNTIARYAITYKDGSPYKFYYSGGVNVGSNNHTSAIGASWTRFSIGCFPELPANGNYNAHILRAAYWTKELPQSQCQTLVL